MATKSTESVAGYLSPSKSFLINRLFSFSGLFVWGCGLLLIKKGLKPFSPFLLSHSNFIEILFLLIVIIHFLYGLSWLQSICLNKLFKAGIYYFFKRFTFLLGFFYLILITLMTHPGFGPDLQDNPVFICAHGALLMAFLFYGYTCFADFFWDWGLMIRRKSWKVIFLYLAVPYLGLGIFLLGTTHFNWLKGISQ